MKEEFIQAGVTQFGSGWWKFDALEEVQKELPDFVGWQRGQGDKREFWIRPEIWRDIFDNERNAAVDAARTLREIGSRGPGIRSTSFGAFRSGVTLSQAVPG